MKKDTAGNVLIFFFLLTSANEAVPHGGWKDRDVSLCVCLLTYYAFCVNKKLEITNRRDALIE